ncbi:MAG: zinc ribbon domain-containing protein [Nitrospiraceae bacterium]
MTEEAPTKPPEEMYCSNCGTPVKRDDQFCPECGTATGRAPGATPSTGAVASRLDRVELRREGLFFRAYPVWVMVLLSILTFGIYTVFWLNHWHGVMPKRRNDDPSTARAIGFLFIPLYNYYWLFESLLRLCTRLDEELADAGLPDRVPRELVRWFCILYLVPYVNLVASPILGGIATGRMQSLVNRLADFDVSESGQHQGTC